MNKSIIIDIDGTLCPIKKEGEEYSDLVPNKDMINKMHYYKENGYKIVLYTSRNMRTYNGDLDMIHANTKPIVEKWLNSNNVPYDEVVYGKLWPGEYGFYIDDRTIRPKEFINMSPNEIDNILEIDRVN